MNWTQIAVVAALSLTACGCNRSRDVEPRVAHRSADSRAAWVDEARIARADEEPQNWLMTNRASGEDHYSPLKQIDESNVAELGFAWQYATQTKRGLEASPIVIDGVLYASGNWGAVYAVDAKTGKELWTYDPKVPGEWGRRACCDVVNRGVAAWKGRIYVGALDGYLIALDARTGKVLWRRDTLIDRSRYQTITGAPEIAGGKVIIGNSGADLGVRGYFSAYDAETGAFAWRFFTVPGDPSGHFEHPELEMAAKTWDRHSAWDVGGGGTVWDSMAYDPQLKLLYVGTGNGSPHAVYSRSPKGGDNLFLASILAIDPATGRLAWHYQTTPGDSWDYTATQQMVLADLQIAGRARKVVMQAPKNGFFYVLDRATGDLISAEKYGKVNWASGIDPKTKHAIPSTQSDYSKGPKLVYPGQAGAHNWHPMSFSAQTGLVYIPLLEYPQIYSFAPSGKYVPGGSNEHVLTLSADDPRAASALQAGVPPAVGDYLQAWDPVAQREIWRIPVEKGMKAGGVLSTAGNLVFQGTSRGFLSVYSADTGALLASINVGTGMIAAPISYSVDGVQYIAIMAGVGGGGFFTFAKDSAAYRYGNEGRIVAFKLNGGPVPLPALVAHDQPVPEPPTVKSSPGMVEHGRRLFDQAGCSSCHNRGGPGLLPDLFALSSQKHTLFKDIVLGGVLQSKGMASFAGELSEADVDDLHAFIVEETKRQHALP